MKELHARTPGIWFFNVFVDYTEYELKNLCFVLFEQKPSYSYHIYIPVGNTPYRKRHVTRTISTTPQQSIVEEGLHSPQSFLVRLTNQFGAFFNPKNASETKATNNNCSKQMLIIVVSRNSCPVASVTMFHTSISCGYCCYTWVSLFNLRHPRDFTKTNLVDTYDINLICIHHVLNEVVKHSFYSQSQ